MTIQSELCALKRKHKLLRVETIWAWAKAHPKSKLYQAIEWDKDKAAYRWQLSQIAELVRIHCVDLEGTRTLVSLSIDRTHGGGYRSMGEVLGDKKLKEILLADALADLQRFEERYKLLQDLVSGVRKLRKREEDKRAA